MESSCGEREETEDIDDSAESFDDCFPNSRMATGFMNSRYGRTSREELFQQHHPFHWKGEAVLEYLDNVTDIMNNIGTKTKRSRYGGTSAFSEEMMLDRVLGQKSALRQTGVVGIE